MDRWRAPPLRRGGESAINIIYILILYIFIYNINAAVVNRLRPRSLAPAAD